MAMVACKTGSIGATGSVKGRITPKLASGRRGACQRAPIRTTRWRRPLTMSGPLALAEDRHPAAVGVDAVDVDLVRADHPVDMNQALVAALRGDLLRRQLAAVDKALRIALAERDVAGGVLVEQGVEEQQPAFRDRRGMRHQRHFAEPARALIRIQHLVEYFRAARSLGLD